MTKVKLHWQILIALVLAVIAGSWTGADTELFGVKLLAVYAFIGALFMSALKMIIVPLVTSSIITGIAGIGGGSGLGKLGGKTLLYYMATSLIAILLGLMVVNLMDPGLINGQPAKEVLGLTEDASKTVEAKVGDRDISVIADVFLSIIPTNVISAAANGQMLGLIFFSLLFGVFMTRIADEYASAQYNFWQGLFQIMMKITDLIMKFAPIGIFGLVAKVVAGMEGDLGDLFETLGTFFLSVVLALALHVLVIMPLILRFVAGVNPWRHYQAMAPALLTAFSTASSSATLPLTMECVEKRAGVSNRTTSFVLPLGATVNMDGTALYECVAAMFIAQAYGLDLPFAVQFTIVLIALLTSIGVAAVPAASLVAISIILASIGLPAEGIGLILAVDRILDMFRTSVNVFSDSCGAVVIGKLQGETDILKDPEPEKA